MLGLVEEILGSWNWFVVCHWCLKFMFIHILVTIKNVIDGWQLKSILLLRRFTRRLHLIPVLMSVWVPITGAGPVDRSTENWDWSLGIRGSFLIPARCCQNLFGFTRGLNLSVLKTCWNWVRSCLLQSIQVRLPGSASITGLKGCGSFHQKRGSIFKLDWGPCWNFEDE